jgi:hypothetical protein
MNRFNPAHAWFRITKELSFLLILLLSNAPAFAQSAQHAHIFAGATSQSPGSALWFVNGNLWDTNSYGGYEEAPACIYMSDNLPELYPGLYQSPATFASLAATIFNAGPSPNAAALGSYIELTFVSLQGPAGASMTLWDERDDPTHPTILFLIPVGLTGGTNRINLSEGDPTDPESDPYGHIHGRRFAVSKPGLYTLGLQLVDTSNNGPNGGPIHTPSAVTYFYFQAGLFLSDFSVTNQTARARFGLPGSKNFVVESTTVLPSTNWITVTNIIGATHSELRWMSDTNITDRTRFYRVREGSE